jgi:hypothetical protein
LEKLPAKEKRTMQNMKLIVYHQDAWQLENLCRRLTKIQNTVLIRTTSAKQLHRMLAFCRPKCLFIGTSDTPSPGEGSLPLEAIVFHADARARAILSDQLLNLGFPVAATLGTMGELRHWLAANAPAMLFFEPDEGQVVQTKGIAPGAANSSNPYPSLREQMQTSGFVLQPYSWWLEQAAAADAQILSDKDILEGQLHAARDFFKSNCLSVPHGLETLPGCWLAQLPGLFFRIAAPGDAKLISLTPSEIWQDRGMLHALFILEKQIPYSEGDTSIWDEVRIFLNLNLRPSRWKTSLKSAA